MLKSSPLLDIAALLVLPACNGVMETNGNSEKGYFQIEPATSLAVGSWSNLTVRDYELVGSNSSGIGFQLISASNDGAAHIRSMNANADLVVDGLAAGSSRIEFSAKADGKSIEDAFTIDVQPVTRLRLGACQDGGVYVRGTNGRVSYTFFNDTSARIKGLGLYPFTIEPTDAVTLKEAESTLDVWTFAIPNSAPTQVSIASSLPGDSGLFVMDMVDRTAIDGIVAPFSAGGHAGGTVTLKTSPTAAGNPVCVRTRQVVTSTTPTICKPYDNGKELASLELDGDVGDVTVHFLAAGTCLLTLSLPELGITVSWQPWTIAARPSGGGGGGDHDWD